MPLKMPKPPEGLYWWVSKALDNPHAPGFKQVQVALVKLKYLSGPFRGSVKNDKTENVLHRTDLVRKTLYERRFLIFHELVSDNYHWTNYVGMFWEFVDALPLDTLETRIEEAAQRVLITHARDLAKKQFDSNVSKYSGLYPGDKLES